METEEMHDDESGKAKMIGNTIESGRVEMSMECKIKPTWTSIDGHTGRVVRGGEGYKLAKEWSEQGDEDFRQHYGAKEFCKWLSQTNCLTCVEGKCFRGKWSTERPSVKRMGPNIPKPGSGGNRYNKEGEEALYLSDSEEGVRRELHRWKKDSSFIYIQLFQLPLNQLKVADFTQTPADHFVTQVFAIAESCNVDGRGPSSYAFSQGIASLIKQHFDGMRVPGVRGERNDWYSNIVIFNTRDWESWLDTNSLICPQKRITCSFFVSD